MELIHKYTDRTFLISQHDSSIDGSYDSFQWSEWGRGVEESGPLNLHHFLPSDRVDISDLAGSVDSGLMGKYLLCRTIAPPFKMASLMTLVEDPTGRHAVRLALYNYSYAGIFEFQTQLKELPVGRILVIKNPLFKSTIDGGLTLRCDAPGDVISVTQSHFPHVNWNGEIPSLWRHLVPQRLHTLSGNPGSRQSALVFKDRGNKYFVGKKFVEAIECYTKGLEWETEGPVFLDLLSNRAAAFLNLGCFQKALEDAERVLEQSADHSKGMYRKVKSLFGLGLLADAASFLELSQHKDKKGLSDLTTQLSIVLKQRTQGHYDVLTFYKAGNVTQDFVTDFVGPISIERIPGRGRGVVILQDIEAGELVMAVKAFATVFPHDVEILQFNVNLDGKVTSSPAHEKLVKRIGEKMSLDPRFKDTIYDLHAGDEFKGQNPPTGVDLRRIEAICKYNGFSGDKAESWKKGSGSDFEGRSEMCGLWVLPAYMNHSCWDSNSTWLILGDMMFIRAFKKIPKGSEVLHSYVSPNLLYKGRRDGLDKHAFLCHCSLCQLDSDSGQGSQERREMLKQIQKCYEDEDLEGILSHVERMERDGDWNWRLSPSLVFPLMELAEDFGARRKDYRKTLELLRKCHLMTENSPMMRSAVRASLNILATCLLLGDKEEGRKWVETLKRDLLLMYGTLDMAKVFGKETLLLLNKSGIPFF